MSGSLLDPEFLKKLEYLELIARRLVFGRQQAQRLSVLKGASIEFRDYREYTPGDDPRTVDWLVYARLGELVVKLFQQEQDLELWLLLDRSASMRFGDPDKFTYARKLAAALAYIGMSNMDSSCVMPFSAGLAAAPNRLRGRGRVFELLRTLDALDPQGRTDLPVVAREFVARVRRPGLVVLISDFYGLQGARLAIDQIRFHRHQLFIIQVAAPWEIDPDIRGDLRLIDAESGEHADVVVTDGLLRRYKAEFARLGEELRTACMKYGIGYAFARSDIPFNDFLRRVLERGGLVA